MNVASLLSAAREAVPGAPSVVLGERRVDYLSLAMTAQRLATKLTTEHAVTPDARVMVILPDVPERAVAYVAVMWCGAIAVFAEPTLSPSELREILDREGVTLAIAWHASAESVETVCAAAGVDCLFVEPREFGRLLAVIAPMGHAQARRDSDPAVILRRPRGGRVARTHGELLAVVDGHRSREDFIDSLNVAIATRRPLRLAGDAPAASDPQEDPLRQLDRTPLS